MRCGLASVVCAQCAHAPPPMRSSALYFGRIQGKPLSAGVEWCVLSSTLNLHSLRHLASVACQRCTLAFVERECACSVRHATTSCTSTIMSQPPTRAQHTHLSAALLLPPASSSLCVIVQNLVGTMLAVDVQVHTTVAEHKARVHGARARVPVFQSTIDGARSNTRPTRRYCAPRRAFPCAPF